MTASSSISGTYLHVKDLAAGGMGSVELAVRSEGRFRRLYAIKRMHPHLQKDADCRAMFLEEARIAGLLSHPNIVSVIDVGEDDGGPYLVMDYVEGVALSELSSALDKAGERLPLQLCLRIAHEVAKGLSVAHECVDHDGTPLHLVHRDVSPQNILIGFDGSVRITDFGIARALGRAVRTTSGVIKGKLAYMSPEQLRFESVDHRADLFALGVVLYEMLAGERLYHGEGAAQRILNEPPPDVGEVRKDVPPELISLLFRLQAKDREGRPADALEVARGLESILVDRMSENEVIDLQSYVRSMAMPERERQRELVAEAREIAETPVPAALSARAPRRRGLVLAAVVLVGVGLASLLLLQSNGEEAEAGGTQQSEVPIAEVEPEPPPDLSDVDSVEETPMPEEPVESIVADRDPTDRRGRARPRTQDSQMQPESEPDPPVEPPTTMAESPTMMLGLEQMDWSGEISE